jgi:hypothetical protein
MTFSTSDAVVLGAVAIRRELEDRLLVARGLLQARIDPDGGQNAVLEVGLERLNGLDRDLRVRTSKNVGTTPRMLTGCSRMSFTCFNVFRIWRTPTSER